MNTKHDDIKTLQIQKAFLSQAVMLLLNSVLRHPFRDRALSAHLRDVPSFMAACALYAWPLILCNEEQKIKHSLCMPIAYFNP